MVLFEKFRNLTLRFLPPMRHTATTMSKEPLTYKFSKDEQNKILNMLNTSNPLELSRLKLPLNQIKCFQSWKAKWGPFKDLSQILEVQGLRDTNLEKLCQRILADSVNQSIKKSTTNKKQLVWPTLTTETAKMVGTIVGIHTDSTGMSWSKMSRDHSVTDWDFYSFGSLPTKILSIDNFNLAMTILKILPPANIYVFEIPSTNSTKSSNAFMQIHELNSMLYALINSSVAHNIEQFDSTTNEVQLNKIYHLRNSLPARLFKTLVGREKVSTIGTVTRLFEQDEQLPCEKVNISESLINQYQMIPKDFKELLGQALLLTITFMELIVNKNPGSHKAIQPGQK